MYRDAFFKKKKKSTFSQVFFFNKLLGSDSIFSLKSLPVLVFRPIAKEKVMLCLRVVEASLREVAVNEQQYGFMPEECTRRSFTVAFSQF